MVFTCVVVPLMYIVMKMPLTYSPSEVQYLMSILLKKILDIFVKSDIIATIFACMRKSTAEFFFPLLSSCAV